ncbi:class I SAM-dependent methyltransferase [Nocardia donostiensis]|uniref:SAM-dependent methyltransferase n=1 Tax=Nocardia donostiensis TaxID=1538463 RepID=A0A1V2THP5_9NOCA|nr:class I SAM-dependent methyltransferase [Nocardia donostiensis]ONM49004.1 SAM-dependent methyltransferase [Nocardia donostiensis]OQS14021.1 SAM-dependent methyltransferase [Nocardia donostiensis]OQS19484.1 SAM-dependent methyltransferase [Nocardia donostiensis]
MQEPIDTGRTRAAYDGVADLYAELVENHLDATPLDRAVLNAFAELVGDGQVADLGCGPGRMTAYLAGLGLDVFGIDLSPRMIELARQRYPRLSFREGTLEALDLPDGSVRGVLAWFSIIHLPPERVPGVLAEFHRVLETGGHALLGFQTSDVPGAVESFDHKVVEGYRWAPDRLSGLLGAAGFAPVARMVREPADSERFGQGSMLVMKQG